jgi:hypothetical protein
MPTDQNSKRRTPAWYIVVQGVIPALVLGVLSWIALQIVDIKTDIPVIKLTVSNIQDDLVRHHKDTKALSDRSSLLHHRNTVRNCAGCHC